MKRVRLMSHQANPAAPSDRACSGAWAGALLLLVSLCLPATVQADPTESIREETSARDRDSPSGESSRIYTSPQALLSEFVGKRRSGLLLQGMDQVVGVTATGLSPIMVVSFTGPVVYGLTEADERAHLVFLYQPWFFIPAILITILVLLKDTILTFASYLKLPLDLLGIVFHAMGFLLGFPLIYQLLNVPRGPGDEGGMGLAGVSILVLMYIFYVSIWVLSNAFEILILLSPIPLVDTVLRIGRGGIIIGMYLLCWIHPVLGFVVAVPIVILSLVLFERTFRLTWLGGRASWDLVSGRRQEVTTETPHLMAFTGLFVSGPPMFTLGQVVRRDGELEFRARRLVVGPWKHYPLSSAGLAVAKGTLYPVIVQEDGQRHRVLLRLLPAYRGQEESLGDWLGTEKIIDRTWGSSARSSWQAIWNLWNRAEHSPHEGPTAG